MVKWLPKIRRQSGPAKSPSRWRGLRRALHFVVWLVVDLFLILVLTLLLPPTRGLLLDAGLGVANRVLPGELDAEVARWPGAGRLEFGGLLWTIPHADGKVDTLIAVDSLMLAVDLQALRHRDVMVDSLMVAGRLLDLPRLVTVMQDTSWTAPADTVAARERGEGAGFPRPGAMALVPSLGVARFDIRVERFQVAPDWSVQHLQAEGSAEFRAEQEPGIILNHASALATMSSGDPEESVRIDVAHLGLGVNLATTPDSLGSPLLTAAVLDSLVLELGPSGTRAMLEAWQAAGPVRLASEGHLNLKGTRYAGALETTFILPDTEHFRAVLPDSFPHQDFGVLAGRLSLEGVFADPKVEGSVRLDLGESQGVEQGLLVAGGKCDLDALASEGLRALSVRLDTLDLGGQGIRLEGAGAYEKGLISLDCRFRLPGDGPQNLFLPDSMALGDLGDLQGELALEGRYDASVVDAKVRLDLGGSERFDHGLLAGSAAFDTDSLKTAGLQALTAHLDTLDLGMLDARVQASASLVAGDISLQLEAGLDSPALPRIFLPFLGEDSELLVEMDAHATGTLERPEIGIDLWGTAEVPGAAVGDLRLTLAGDADEIEALLAIGDGLVYEGASLDSLRAGVRGRVTALDSLQVGFHLAAWRDSSYIGLGGGAYQDSLRMVRLDSLVMRAEGQAMQLERAATLQLGPGPQDFRIDGLDFMGDAGLLMLDAHWDSTSVGLLGDIDLLFSEELLQVLAPTPFWSTNGGMDLELDADIRLEGRHGDPQFAGDAGVRLISHRNEPTLGMDLNFRLAKGDTAALVADLGVSSGDTLLLVGDFLWPGTVDLTSGSWRPDTDRELLLNFPEQMLRLGLVNKALPEGFSVGGRLDFAASVALPAPSAVPAVGDSAAKGMQAGKITGYLRSGSLPVDLPNRSRMQLALDLNFSNSVVDPMVGGKITVESGFFRIPEIPRNLHPVEGNSMLWTLHDSTVAALDSLQSGADSLLIFARPDQVGPAITPKGPAFLPQMDLKIIINNNLRVHGYGLDIQLGGELQVGRALDDKGLPFPKVAGQVASREGSLTFMNRKFKVERCNVQFHGAVPPDPLLDMMLEAQVGNTRVRILVSGTAEAPVVELTSDPDMNEADIMAVLLFGRPLNDLDNDQRGASRDEGDPAKELRENLAGLAMAFGTAGLQDSMTQSMGVDMVGMGSDSKGDATLMVGKFITPEVMVKYQQSLEKSGTYFMTLEYSLSQYFKLVSTYGQGEEASGAEVKWTRRY